MAFAETQIIDGALYAICSLVDMGFQLRGPMTGLIIPYKPQLFEEMATVFTDIAKTTCPVDTGFLRDHIGAKAGNGGCEFYSEADYSAYQEYGTSKMAPQPYFEAALDAAIMSVYDDLREIETKCLEFDTRIAVFMISGVAGDLPQLIQKRKEAEQLRDEINDFDGLNSAPLDKTIADLDARIAYLESIQAKYAKVQAEAMGDTAGILEGILSMLIQSLAMAISSIVTSVLTWPLQAIWAGVDDNDFNATRGCKPVHNAGFRRAATKGGLKW